MKKLRLILFDECNRSCEGCCNKDYDIPAIPIVNSFKGYDEVLITGGEPMLKPDLVLETVNRIRRDTTENYAGIFMYTAKSKRAMDLIAMLHVLEGITLTLHEEYDVKPFIELNNIMLKMPSLHYKSLRLNVFNPIDLHGIDLSLWKVKENITWIKDCPLPEHETLMRL